MTRRAFLLFGLIALSLSSCKSVPTIPEPASMPSGASFTGVWYSPQFEQMYLRQSGKTVRGIYTYKYGGTLEGEVSGNLLVFKWIDPGDSSQARRTFKGSGFLQLKPGAEDGFVLKGSWGYNDDAHGGGPWEAQYIRELDESDPKNIEEFRSSQVR